MGRRRYRSRLTSDHLGKGIDVSETAKPHWSFWLILAAGVLWHLGTVMNFFSQLSPEGAANLPEQYRAIAENRPGWATVAFAAAGFGGLIGCVLGLMRRRLAIVFLWVSAAGAIGEMIPALSVTESGYRGSVVTVFVMTLVVIGFLILYVRRADRQGLLH